MTCLIKFGIICQLWIRMSRSKHDLSAQIWSHLSVVNMDVEIYARFVSKNVKIKTWFLSKDVEIKTWFCQLKFGAICQMSVRRLTSKHDLSDKIWNQLSIRMSRSKHDLSVKICNHLSFVSTDVEIEAWFIS